MLNRILDFIEGRYVHCPRCLKRLPIRSQVYQFVPCEGCGFTIPLAYIRECKNAPPVFVQLFGLTGAGKTMFLDMLRLHLYDMDQAWEAAGFYAQPITQLDKEHKEILQDERARGVLPGSTPKRDRDQNEVYIMSLKRMVRWDSRFLVLMDHAGEQFGKLIVDVKEIPFLQHTPVTILLLSLPDLIRDRKRVDNLINSYITSLEANKVDFKKESRQLIIVFSKADLIPDLPHEVNDYLSKDTTYRSLKNRQRNFKISSEAGMNSHIFEMSIMSNAIRKWVEEKVLGGAAMLNMLDDRGIATRFTVMSATGHPLSSSRNALAPTPRRVLDPFFWVLEYYKRLGSQDVVQATWSTILATFSPALRKVGSLILLVLLFFCTLGGSLYATAYSHGSSGFVGFCLSLVLLFVCTLVNQRMEKKDPVVRSVLNTTRLALFLSCIALQTLPSVQQALSRQTLYQLLGIFIVGTALFSCFQPAARLAAQSRVTLATIAGAGALLLSTYGASHVLPALPFMRPDAYEFMKPDVYALMNNIFAWGLVVGAVLALLLSTKERIWVDWTILFVLALVYGAFQFVYGPQEIHQALPFLPPKNVVFVNATLVFIVAIALPLSLFFLHRFKLIDRVPLLILALVCAGMLNFLGKGVVLPIGAASLPSLTSTVVDLLMPGRMVGYGLVAASLLIGIRFLFTRFPGEFAFWDYVVLFLAAVVCAQLQAFPWGSLSPQGSLPLGAQAVFLAINRFVASSLIWLVFIGCAVALVMLLLPLARQFKRVELILKVASEQVSWLTDVPLWLERVPLRLMLLGTTAGCALLVGLYGQVGAVLLQPFSIGGVVITYYQIVALLFATFAIITLRRLTQPFTRGDRFLLLMNIVLCAAFYILKTNPLIPLSLVLQGWNKGAYHSQVPNLLFGFLLVCMALISFWWYVRRKLSGDRRLLQILSGLALAGGLLQLMLPSLFFTLLALLALIMGVVVAMISAGSTV